METSDPIPEDMCRACKATDTEMVELFQETDGDLENPRIDEMLMACASIQVHRGDGLPHHICTTCLAKIKDAYSLRKSIEKINTELSIKKSTTIKHNAELCNLLNELFENNVENNEAENISNDVKKILKESDFVQVSDLTPLILTCRQCLKVFATLEGLKSHKRFHTGSMFKCDKCDKCYTRNNHLQRHLLTHSNQKVHMCKICNKVLTRGEHLKRHLITHLKSKQFSCEKCSKGFNRAEHLQNHLLKCKGEPCTWYVCDICNRSFIREASMLVHKAQHVNQEPILPTMKSIDDIEEFYIEIDYDPKKTKKSDDSEDEDEESETEDNMDVKVEPVQSLTVKVEAQEDLYIENQDSDDEDYKPKRRTRRMTKKLKLKRATGKKRGRPRKVPIEEPLVPPVERKYITTTKESINIKEPPESPTICPLCKETFNSSEAFDNHAEELHKQSEYVCDICEEPSQDLRQLATHRMQHQNPTREQLKCKLCDITFKRESLLEEHLVDTHKGDVKCGYCELSFENARAKAAHEQVHRRRAALTCKTCGKVCYSKSQLTEHVKFHSSDGKKFLCSECGQRFIRNDYLIIHMRRHRGEKPFKCKFCGKGFPRTTDLTVHERYHTGEKTHLCVVCGRGFGRAYNLTVHMRTHTGEKPYRCTYCDAAFAQGNDLKAHVRRHTGERFHCDMCPETFLMGYLLTQHKRSVHGLNVVSNIRRLQSIKQNPDEPPPMTITLPAPICPENVYINTHLDEIERDDYMVT